MNMAEATTQTPWRLKVHWLETCNCESGCNCNFGGFPDHGFCQAICGMAVEEGRYGDVDLAGVRAVYAGKWPKAIHEGHGQVVVFVDTTATPEQAAGLTAILSGREGGLPWEIFATTLDRFDGPVRRPITMTIDGRRSSFQIDGVLDVALTPLKNPVTGEENEVHIVFPKGGLIWNDGDTATTEKMRIDYGELRYEHPQKSSFYALTEWTNQK
jgi:hypothetical protein